VYVSVHWIILPWLMKSNMKLIFGSNKHFTVQGNLQLSR
jgi:hypothetical protein